MKCNKVLLTLMAILMLGVITACSGDKGKDDEASAEKGKDNVNESGVPIVDDEVTIKMFTAKAQNNSDIDWNDLPAWNKYEEMTNIDIDWTDQVTMESLEEKRNLALGAGTLPDAFFASNLSNPDLLKYGEQGVFLPL